MPLSGALIAFVLTVLLVGTTPVGTGTGVHQWELVHPLVGHVHLLDGRLVSHEPTRRGQALSAGPAFAADHATNASAELGTTSTAAPEPVDVSADAGVRHRWPEVQLQVPAGRLEAPADPPPV